MKNALLILLLLFPFPAFNSFAEEAHPGVLGAKNFIELVATGNIEKAYEITSSEFRRVNSQADFKSYVAEMKLDQLRSFNTVTATAPEDDSEVTIIANSKTASDTMLETRIKTVLENGAYLTAYFQAYPKKEKGNPPVGNTQLVLPAAQESLKLAAKAIEEDNFSPYVDRLAMMHRQTFGKAMISGIALQLHQSPYGTLTELESKLEPAFDAEIEGDLASYFHAVDFPEKERRIVMEFASLWNDPNPDLWLNRWRVMFYCTAENLDAPPEEEATALIKNTLGRFFDGARAGDMTAFFESTSSYLQEVTSVENFTRGFPYFTSGENNLSEWKSEESAPLSFKLSGEISQALVLEATLPGPGGAAYVTLTYLNESGTWGLSGIRFSKTHPDEREKQ